MKEVEHLISTVLPQKGPVINAKKTSACSLEEFISITPFTMIIKSCNRVLIEDFERYYLVFKNNESLRLEEKMICYYCKGTLEGSTEVVNNAPSIGKQLASLSFPKEDIVYIIHDSYRDAPLDDCDYPSVRMVTVYKILQ